MSEHEVSPTLIRTFLEATRRHSPERELCWGFGLTLYGGDDELPAPRRLVDGGDDHPIDLDSWLDHVGIITLRGTRLPLTKGLVRQMSDVAWLKGRLACVLWVPHELENLGDHEALPSVGIHVRTGYTTGQTVLEPDQDTTPVSFTSRLDPDDCRHQHLVVLTRRRPEGWPP